MRGLLFYLGIVANGNIVADDNLLRDRDVITNGDIVANDDIFTAVGVLDTTCTVCQNNRVWTSRGPQAGSREVRRLLEDVGCVL